MPPAAKSYDLDRIRAGVDLKELCEREGVVFRRDGSDYVALCPFHQEKSGSFRIRDSAPHRAHCFGCGWSGDVFAYWLQSRGFSDNDKEGFKQCVAELAVLAGAPPISSAGAAKKAPAPAWPPIVTLDERRKPWLPPMRHLRGSEIHQLSALRGISRDALLCAIADRRLAFSHWPYNRETGGADARSRPSWVITDDERWCAQFRPLDGSLYDGRDGHQFKSYSTKNVCWSVGCAQTGERERIVLVEGGADMLAAYQLALEAGVLQQTAVWCVFGASVRICQESLAFARGRRVRIFADNDPPQEKTFKHRPPVTIRPGIEGAAAWCAQFTAAGAAHVDVYDLSPLGEEIKDLNDIVDPRKCGSARVDVPHLFDF